jgi:hypothetical protein
MTNIDDKRPQYSKFREGGYKIPEPSGYGAFLAEKPRVTPATVFTHGGGNSVDKNRDGQTK